MLPFNRNCQYCELKIIFFPKNIDLNFHFYLSLKKKPRRQENLLNQAKLEIFQNPE
jgi:hypothetical protein